LAVARVGCALVAQPAAGGPTWRGERATYRSQEYVRALPATGTCAAGREPGKFPLAAGGWLRPSGSSAPAMTSSAYLPFLIQALLAAAITGGVLAASHLFGQRFKKNKIKDSAYECGIAAEGLIHTRFSVKFYLTALLFMLFDLEVVILIPWTFVYREFLANHIAILGPMLFFIGVLVLGLVYEVKKGALEWEK
jgi:NADH-quinone oxidoreductase subunit A